MNNPENPLRVKKRCRGCTPDSCCASNAKKRITDSEAVTPVPSKLAESLASKLQRVKAKLEEVKATTRPTQKRKKLPIRDRVTKYYFPKGQSFTRHGPATIKA